VACPRDLCTLRRSAPPQAGWSKPRYAVACGPGPSAGYARCGVPSSGRADRPGHRGERRTPLRSFASTGRPASSQRDGLAWPARRPHDRSLRPLPRTRTVRPLPVRGPTVSSSHRHDPDRRRRKQFQNGDPSRMGQSCSGGPLAERKDSRCARSSHSVSTRFIFPCRRTCGSSAGPWGYTDAQGRSRASTRRPAYAVKNGPPAPAGQRARAAHCLDAASQPAPQSGRSRDPGSRSRPAGVSRVTERPPCVRATVCRVI